MYPIVEPKMPGLHEFPSLGLDERDRRYEVLTEWMTRDGLDALVVFGSGRDTWDRYLTNETLGATVVLTASGVVSTIGGFPLARFDPSGGGYERWVQDVRVAPPAAGLRAVLDEHGLAGSSTVGVVGLSGLGFGQHAGSVSHSTWVAVLAELPEVTFLDASAEFERIAMVKSPAERHMVRKAAAIGEAACEAFVSATRVGARESTIAGAAIGAIVSAGGWVYDPVICFRAGRDRMAWGRPEWIGMGGGGRVLDAGDSAAAELFSFYGGFETQQQIEAHIGEPDATVRALEEVCLTAYADGLDVLAKPGATFTELADAMMTPMLRAGYWNTGPQVHGVGPCWPNTATHVGTENDPALAELTALPPVRAQDGDVTIVPGMAFAFEPNALHRHRRVCIGGTVMLTEDGIEELNQLAKRVHVVG